MTEQGMEPWPCLSSWGTRSVYFLLRIPDSSWENGLLFGPAPEGPAGVLQVYCSALREGPSWLHLKQALTGVRQAGGIA